METHGIIVFYATIQRYEYKFISMLDKEFRQRKNGVIISWRLDDTYIKDN